MAVQHPNNDPFEEVKFTFSFVAHPCENEHSTPTSLKPKPCPSSYLNIALDKARDSTLILHDISLENKNCWAMDNFGAPTLELKKNDSTSKHEGFSFETPCVSCSPLDSLELITFSATRFYKDHNHLLILISKLFRRMVVDAYVYHKYCKFRSSTMVLTLQLEWHC